MDSDRVAAARTAPRASAEAPGRLAEWGVATLLILTGAALRVHGFSDHALWIDEYGTAWAVAGEGLGALFERVNAVQGQSPFYYAIVRGSELALGRGILALRLPSLLCGLGLLVLALPLARAAFRDRQVALGALAAFALNERLIFYAQEARPYALALLCVAASFLCFLRMLEDPHRRRWQLGWVASAVATFYAHYLFSLALVAQALHLAWHAPKGLAGWRPWLEAGGAALLLCAPGVLHGVALLGRRDGLDWLGNEGGVLPVWLHALDPPVLALSALAACVAAWAAGGLRRLAATARPAVVVGWWLLPFAALGALPALLGVNLAHPRYLLQSVPALALLQGFLLALPARGRVLRWLPLAAFVVAVFAWRLLPPYENYELFSERYWTERWDRAALALFQQQRPGEPILYQTNFVELDAVVRGDASPLTVEFTTWPLAAHLPPPRRAALQALPFSETPEMTRALEERLDAAARRPSTWVVAMPPAIARVMVRVRRDPRLALDSHERFGKVHLLRLRGEGGGT